MSNQQQNSTKLIEFQQNSQKSTTNSAAMDVMLTLEELTILQKKINYHLKEIKLWLSPIRKV